MLCRCRRYCDSQYKVRKVYPQGQGLCERDEPLKGAPSAAGGADIAAYDSRARVQSRRVSQLAVLALWDCGGQCSSAALLGVCCTSAANFAVV